MKGRDRFKMKDPQEDTTTRDRFAMILAFVFYILMLALALNSIKGLYELIWALN